MSSTFSSVVELLLSAIRFFSELFSRKRDETEDLRRRIEETKKLLAQAIDEGRITDIMSLRGRLESLMKELEGRKSMEVAAAKAVAPVLFLAVLCSGCLTKKNEGQPVLVVGERILVVEPGSTVPPLVPPAKKWYLVDSVAYKDFVGADAFSEE